MTVRPNHRPPKAKIVTVPMDRDFYTIYEVADMMGLHHNTIRKLIKSGDLKAKKLGGTWKIRKVDLEKFTTPEGVK